MGEGGAEFIWSEGGIFKWGLSVGHMCAYMFVCVYVCAGIAVCAY